MDSDRLAGRGTSMSAWAPATSVAGPVVLWPLFVAFLGVALVGVVWSLLVGRDGRST